uniref:Dystrophin n=1 Tax=Angiostrongylus cantonensis TaxID=6313 RepID=A0A158P9I2_ANGCA
MRSRKSSSSSQISSKSKRARKEEMTREFENCLEQVLTWLLEAEEELNLLENVNQNDLKAVRKQFKDFELFMASLTESQDTVGRVLHRRLLPQLSHPCFSFLPFFFVHTLFLFHPLIDTFFPQCNFLLLVMLKNIFPSSSFSLFISDCLIFRGQLLCGKAENEDERIAIEGQLRVVNGRWEALRELSMQRQNELQLNINKLQNLELESIDKWLGVVELEMTSCEPLAATAETAIQQIEAHSRLQSKIHDFQDTINDLSSFVAVVDDVDSSEERIGALEQRLQSIGDRWRAICEWAEVRATQLDGLAELCAHTNEVFEMLNEWLKEREHELLGLKSAHHLEDSQQVAEQFVQIRKLQHAETALEAEHSSFVKLSQLSCELVARLEKGNSGAANDVRRRLDTVTQRWDNLVARIEEHSRTLVQSGKADVRQIKRARELPTVCPSSSHEQKAKAAQVVKQNEAPLKAKPCETLPAGSQETTDTESEEAGNQIVERFLRHVAKLTTELEPLRAWSASFTISKKPDQVRKMINVCQEKLIEIKEQEARVNRLQLELEHMHLSSSLSTSQLKKANDAFETFAKNWAKIVTKISEAMNVLTGQDMSDKETRVAKGVEQWIESCDKWVQTFFLDFLNKNITFIEKDPVKRAILKKGLDIVRKRIEVLTQEQTTSKTEAEVNVELENKWCTVGDVDLLDKEVQRAEKIVELARKEELSAETIEKAETRLAEMIEKRRATIAALEKMKAAEEGLQSIAVSVEATSSSDLSIGGTIVELEHAREQLTSYQTLKKEAERAAEKMLALDDNVPHTMLTSTRNRIRNLSDQWRDLENAIEDHLNCARKEHRRSVQKKISNEERFLEELEKRLTDSERASDAEECCEHLDNLESLLEKVDSPLEVDESSIPSMDESFVRESYLRLNETRRRLADATRERIAALSRAVADCEHFEKQMADVQQWSSTVSTLLDLRKSSDVSALDVPDEYKAKIFSCSYCSFY